MTSQRPRTIAQYLFRFFQLFSVLWIGGLGLFWLAQVYSHFSGHVGELEARALARHRAELRTQVEQALDYIHFMRAQTEERTRTLLRERVELAHRAAAAFVARNQDKLRPEALRSGLRELLRSMSGGPGKPYLFAMDYDGVVQLFPPFPEREGQNELDVLDGEGEPVNRRLLALAREKEEGFHQYVWVRPGKEELAHGKLSFVMAFEPLNWIIGAGKYLSDMEAAVRRETLRRIETIRFGNHGYVFAGDWNGTSLSGPAKGRNMRDATDADGVKIVQELIRLARNDGGWLTYRMPPLDGRRQALKMSYVRGVPKWEWYVGAGVYLDQIEAETAAEKKWLRKALLQTLGLTGLFLLLSLAAAMPISRRVAERIGRDFRVFKRFFKEAAERDAEIDPEEIRLRELRETAELANRMIALRRKAERSYRESEERFALALKGANDGLWDWNIKTDAIYFSPRWKEMLGYAPEELADEFQTWQGLIHPEDLPEAWRRYEDYMTDRKERFEMEFRMRRRDGSYAPILSRAFKQVDAAGAPVRLVGTHVDLTPLRRAEAEKSRLEAQLRQSQKMEAVGQLAGGVAHDFNNLLQVINGHVDLVLMEMAEDRPEREHLTQVARAGARATRLVAQLLAFSRRQVMEPQDLDLNEVIAHLLSMLRRVIGEHIRLDFTPAARGVAIHGDRAMLEQVLMNLCVNARDAMDAGGLLTLRTGTVDLDADFAAAHPWARPGRFVRLDAADTGCGMPPEVAERVFEPFFTTKETGKGTGLGLATVYGIVQQHKGMIQVYSEPGRGTTFSLYLPRIDGPARVEAEPAGGEVRGGTETILLAEDNDMVRELTIALLERAGYAVVAVPDGAEAMERFRASPDRFDLLLLDVVMPRAGGREVFADARSIRPDVPALFASGYNENALHTHFVLDAGLRLIRKPFTQPELLGRVREALDAARMAAPGTGGGG